jgi:hypothetical protein
MVVHPWLEEYLDKKDEEITTLRQAITLLAASHPTALITGKTKNWIEEVAKAVATGKPLPKRGTL